MFHTNFIDFCFHFQEQTVFKNDIIFGNFPRNFIFIFMILTNVLQCFIVLMGEKGVEGGEREREKKIKRKHEKCIQARMW